MRELKQGQWLRIAGVNVVLKEDKENAINGKQKDSVREETNVVSGTMNDQRAKPTPKPLHFLNHHHREVEVRRGKRKPQRPESIWEVRSTAVQKITWKVFAPNHLVIIGISPECQFL